MPDLTPRRAPRRLAAVLAAALALAATACVSTPAVPREDVRATEQDFVADAARQILADEGYELERDDGCFLQSTWRAHADDDGHPRRERIHVRISETSMGVALATRITRALPVPEGTPLADDDASIVVIDGQPWRLDDALADQARAEESRIAKAIQARWHELRRRHAATLAAPR